MLGQKVSILFDQFIPLVVRLRRGGPHVAMLVDRLRASGFDFSRFERTIRYRPRQWQLFLQALMHRSYLQLIGKEWGSNERLEFLGDAVLNAVVAEDLYKKHPLEEEGVLTKLRARLVNRKTLAIRARDMNLTDFLLLSTSAAQSIDSGSESILADAFEAILGATYLDGGAEAAKRFVRIHLLDHPEAMATALTDDNYKSALLEYSQGNALGIPKYAVVKEEGPEHDRRFTVEVAIGKKPLGIGSGRSKKDAEQSAAAQALDYIRLHKSEIFSQRDARLRLD
ncbi:MAG: ribonuclease III [Ignavibacteriales bacterium]|nr:ribonuclease III [Ignavibacteriales bacterium]